MRRLLEASWNVETMGPVPTNADSAAETAVVSILNAEDRSSTSLFFVDLLLPQYDIKQGSNLYDEVLAVEFCIAVANRLKGKTAIVVRDDKTIQTVSRILDARERGRLESSADQRYEYDDDEDEDDDEDDKKEGSMDSGDSEISYYDDFAGLGLEDDADEEPSSMDVDAFREQLIAGWDSSKDAEKPKREKNIRRTPEKSRSGVLPPRRYRLTSMLGSETFSSGPDMAGQVMRAVAANGKPSEDEETLIILSATSAEEMVGVRGLVSKYDGKKKIILVNCNLQPVPRELMMAKTVYSIQPFIARPKVSEGNIFGANPAPVAEEEATPPKVVVMRRFPRDWEVFVDLGSGFELARTVPSAQVDKKGPSMQFIASCVKEFLQSRQG